ncbi:hypothetical protein Daus18300_009331 [Diaporthe australafricana]|uniref:Uncharacterized protein n=1 Tax=Diaporthe australafricana TaxID=127596 RepID=A0ABR3WEU9_9PEZI
MLVFKFFLGLLSLLVGVSSAHAGLLDTRKPPPPIVNNINKVRKEVADFGSAVEHWSGNIIETSNITAASKSIIESINEGIETAEKGKKLSIRQAIKTGRAAKELVQQIQSTVDILVREKPLFSHAGLNDIMISKIGKQKELASKLIDTIVGKLPKIGRKKGRKLGVRINAAFDVALTAYRKLP